MQHYNRKLHGIHCLKPFYPLSNTVSLLSVFFVVFFFLSFPLKLFDCCCCSIPCRESFNLFQLAAFCWVHNHVSRVKEMISAPYNLLNIYMLLCVCARALLFPSSLTSNYFQSITAQQRIQPEAERRSLVTSNELRFSCIKIHFHCVLYVIATFLCLLLLLVFVSFYQWEA